MKCAICKKTITRAIYEDSNGVKICSDNCLEKLADKSEKQRSKQKKVIK
jgi:predicted nucleic acid-binding Zn ribbon protein